MTLQRAIQYHTGGMIKARQLVTGELQLSISWEDREIVLYHIWDEHYNLLEEFDRILTDEDRAKIAKWDADLELRSAKYVKAGYMPIKRSLTSLGDLESEALHEWFCNDSEFEEIAPWEIAALTDAPIIGFSDERGESYERVWWYPDYAIRSFVEDLLERGESIWKAGE